MRDNRLSFSRICEPQRLLVHRVCSTVHPFDGPFARFRLSLAHFHRVVDYRFFCLHVFRVSEYSGSMEFRRTARRAQLITQRLQCLQAAVLPSARAETILCHENPGLAAGITQRGDSFRHRGRESRNLGCASSVLIYQVEFMLMRLASSPSVGRRTIGFPLHSLRQPFVQ